MTIRDDSGLIGTLPCVVSQAEYGARGYMVTLARYGSHRMDQWRRRGGRRKNPTLAEINAASEAAEMASKDRRRARSRRPVVGSAEAEIAAEVAGASSHGPVRASASTTGGGDSAATATRFA